MCFSSIITSVFRRGNPSGNVASPRMDVSIVDLPAYQTTTVQNTNSMEPLIDVGHTVILSVKAEDLDSTKVGDIIIWRGARGDIIHSVIEVAVDTEGWYSKTQGLNLNSPDPEKIRRSQILSVAVGVLWTKGNSEGGD